MLHRFFHFLKQSLLVVLCILLLGGLLAGGWFFYQGRQLYRSAASSYPVASMYDTLCARGSYTSYDALPQIYINAVICTEDEHFMTHKGIDPGAIARALLADPLMVLVNHTNKMPDDYTFDTKECGSATAVNKTLQTVACDAFLAMQKAAAADGVTVWMQSGYRSVKYQTSLYEKKTQYYLNKGYDNAAAKEKAAAVVNPPGYSEHNCGLAADLNSPEHAGLDEGFENTAAFRWLCAHAGDYGFILRYPKDAEDKTEIIYEPWHWRYVGVENAARINASGLCFEEYIQTLRDIAAEG